MAGKGALGATFLVVRIFQAMSLIAIIGMTANFIAEMVNSGETPPDVLVGVISVVSCLETPSFILKETNNMPC